MKKFKENVGLIVTMFAIFAVFVILGVFIYKISINTESEFNYAYITFPNGHIEEIEVDSWSKDSGSVTINSKNGNVYCISMYNCLLSVGRLPSLVNK